jgi:hypothetical protein
VVLCGGLASANADHILPILNDILQNDRQRYQISICKATMTEGALYLAGMPRTQEEASC